MDVATVFGTVLDLCVIIRPFYTVSRFLVESLS
jgi:hypothetical protein